MTKDIHEFHMPRYQELPNVGLYLVQTVKYINSFLTPLGCMEITSSMISNYVKKGYIQSPVKKQYYAEQIAYLFFIAIVKNVLSMENIERLFAMQKHTYDTKIAYDYFCQELENMLFYIFGEKDKVEEVGKDAGEQKKMLRSTIIAVAHIIYLSHCFEELETKGRDSVEPET